MTIYLILTALTVSVDSFFCGFSLSFSSGKKLPIIFGIAITVLVMCIITNYCVAFLSNVITEKTASLGGLILIGLGIFNLCKGENETPTTGGIIRQSLVSGFAVGLDGALANLSLSLMGINEIYVPLTIALMHAITIAIGAYLADIKITKKAKRLNFLSPLILILLGVYKLIQLFL